MILMLMGVSGCGKTTVGQLLAARLKCGFSDADSFHPPENVEKMRAGLPLQDEDRWPWLRALRAAIEGWQAAGEDRVIACSALKQAYRDILSPPGDALSPQGGLPSQKADLPSKKGELRFIWLKGSAELIGSRLESRKGHYFNPALLESQFAALEAPVDALQIDILQAPEDIADEIVAKL